VPSRAGIEAYEVAGWSPRRSHERLEILYRQGMLSQRAYERLAALVPGEVTVA
jgi:hypothetical protein